MKRYGHAWIAIRAIDRLGAMAEQYEAKDPEKGEALKYFQGLLKEKINLVVEGAWLPDNVIRDNRDGHIWKYEPLLKAGDERRYRKYHEDTISLCYQEAQYTYAWDKLWAKSMGYLVYRCIAVQQMMRDMILYQRDEMHRLAATLMVKFGDKLYTEPTKVETFLASPTDVKGFYDKRENGDYVNRHAVIDIRNSIGRDKETNNEIKKCLNHYGDNIKTYITKENARQFEKGESSFFPLFYTDDQIALTFFTLSHYLADGHMPLHCDAREFSNDDCNDVHGKIEKVWEDWVIEGNVASDLIKSLSETDRANCFIKRVFPDGVKEWGSYKYPDDSILKEFDDEFGERLWDERKGRLYEGGIWDDIAGVTYASYCIASRLIKFDDQKRVVPKGTKTKYEETFDINDDVIEIKSQEWKNWPETMFPDNHFENSRSSIQRALRDIRRDVFEWVKANHGGQLAFNYLSLLLLVDAVECIARIWADSILDHLKIAYSRKRKS